jgi:hypothetical protein
VENLNWSEGTVFTNEHAEHLKELGACTDVYEYEGMLIGTLVQKFPWEALQYIHTELSQERFNECVDRQPWAAMWFAYDRLSDDQVRMCAQRRPDMAAVHLINKNFPTMYDPF